MSYLNTSLGVSLGSLEALLGLLEVDDRPNVLEVVCGREINRSQQKAVSVINEAERQ